MSRARETNRVRIRREQQDMLLKQLATKADVSAPMLCNVEGGFVPKRQSQVKIAAALCTTPENLWPEEYA